jgi:2-octaprenyl-6-methoxyphenol hydroxylase
LPAEWAIDDILCIRGFDGCPVRDKRPLLSKAMPPITGTPMSDTQITDHEIPGPACRDQTLPAMAQVIIAGAGAVGLCLALALKQELGPRFNVVVADPGLGLHQSPRHPDHRAWAVAAAARRMLDTLGIWPDIARAAVPIHEMVITDSRTHDVVRPSFLTFARDETDDGPFAHIILADHLSAALENAARAAGVELVAAHVAHAENRPGSTLTTFSDGAALRCRLLVAADGAKSRLRTAAGLGWIAQDYAQSGLVATIGHQRPHQGRAIEHFLPGGPFAMLPLPDDGAGHHRSSIVWSEQHETVAVLLALAPTEFLREVETRFGLALGDITLLDTPRAFPLSFGLAHRFVSERLALVGDAAHVVHPIAGQGLNLGLKDVAALAEIITDAARLGLDIGAAPVLDSYERARRADTVMMGMGMDMLNRLFSNDSTALRLARDLGLGMVERLPGLKQQFMAQAAGERGTAPRMMRGQRL